MEADLRCLYNNLVKLSGGSNKLDIREILKVPFSANDFISLLVRKRWVVNIICALSLRNKVDFLIPFVNQRPVWIILSNWRFYFKPEREFEIKLYVISPFALCGKVSFDVTIHLDIVVDGLMRFLYFKQVVEITQGNRKVSQ